MTFSPTAAELRRTYAEEPFSVFSVTRLALPAGSAQVVPSVHPTFFFTLGGNARIAAAGSELAGERGTVVHACDAEASGCMSATAPSSAWPYPTSPAGVAPPAAQARLTRCGPFASTAMTTSRSGPTI